MSEIARQNQRQTDRVNLRTNLKDELLKIPEDTVSHDSKLNSVRGYYNSKLGK